MVLERTMTAAATQNIILSHSQSENMSSNPKKKPSADAAGNNFTESTVSLTNLNPTRPNFPINAASAAHCTVEQSQRVKEQLSQLSSPTRHSLSTQIQDAGMNEP